MKNRIFTGTVFLVLLSAVLFGQTEEEQLSSLLDNPDSQGIETFLLEREARDDYLELKVAFLNRAKELVLSNQYRPALHILEALLSVDLDNTEVQEIYLAVDRIVREEEAAKLAQAEVETEEGSGEAGPVAEGEEPSEEQPEEEQDTGEREPVAEDVEEAGLTADQIAEAVAEAVAKALAQDGAEPGSAEMPDDSSSAEAGRDQVRQGEEIEAETATRVPTIVLGDIIDWSLHIGAVDLLLYGSQFYTDFYGEGQVFLSYGLSLDVEAILKLKKLNLSGEINFDTFFADFVPLSGTEVAYRLMVGAALPELIAIPLYLRVGFGQFWYLFGEETPNKLITAVPSPLLGIKLNGMRFGRIFSVDGAVDYYLITFFTSYIASAFDITAALEIDLPIKSSLAFTTRVEVMPTIIIGSGGAETSAKLKISFGIGNDEDT